LSVKNVSSIPIPRLNPYPEEIIEDHQCRYRYNRELIIIFCIHQILEKEPEYNEAVSEIFIDFKKAHE
jgi:hypothetical protein